jgi:hypothetical protein
MKQRNLYSVSGKVSFSNKLFVAETPEQAVAMYNSLVIERNERFNENLLLKANDAVFKGIVYVY